MFPENIIVRLSFHFKILFLNFSEYLQQRVTDIIVICQHLNIWEFIKNRSQT